jgi:general secretion pathway protein G
MKLLFNKSENRNSRSEANPHSEKSFPSRGTQAITSRSGSNSRRRGFTLIELLLVLVILGVLAAIVVPKFAGRTEQARQTAATSQISTFGTALDAFEVDNGYYPKGKNGLQDLVAQPRDSQNWKGPYMKNEIPNDPWGRPYLYESPGKHNPTSYDIQSLGPDGRANTDDDIANWQSRR